MPHTDKPPHSSFGGFFGESYAKEEKRVATPSIVQKKEKDSVKREVSEEERMAGSQIRQNFHPEVEERLNKQINLNLQACYAYRSMGIYFERHDVALLGFAKFFMNKAEKKRERAKKMMHYLNRRGGSLACLDIVRPAVDSWGTGLAAILTCLDMEKNLNEALLDLHALARKRVDPDVEKFLKKYIRRQVKIIKELGNHVTNLQRVGTKGLGVYMFDQKTLKSEAVTKVAKRTKVIKVIKIAKRHGNKDDSDSSDSSDSDSD